MMTKVGNAGGLAGDGVFDSDWRDLHPTMTSWDDKISEYDLGLKHKIVVK